METPTVFYEPNDTVITNQGNKISRKAKTYGTQNIILNGNSILMNDCLLRGDLAFIRMGKYCVVSEVPCFINYSLYCTFRTGVQGTIIRPPYKYFSKGLTFFPIHFGDYVYIEKGCVIVAVFVGSFVHIGENCIIERSCVIKDCCYILANSVVMPDTVIPPFSIVGGNPAKVLGEWPPTCQKLMTDACTGFYDNYLPNTTIKKTFTSLE